MWTGVNRGRFLDKWVHVSTKGWPFSWAKNRIGFCLLIIFLIGKGLPCKKPAASFHSLMWPSRNPRSLGQNGQWLRVESWPGFLSTSLVQPGPWKDNPEVSLQSRDVSLFTCKVMAKASLTIPESPRTGHNLGGTLGSAKDFAVKWTPRQSVALGGLFLFPFELDWHFVALAPVLINSST